MSRKTAQHIVMAGVLAIALAVPAQAEVRELRGPVPAWQWLTSLWENGVSVLWPEDPAGIAEKQGPGTDPNGSPLADPSGTTCGLACEQGPGTDPNGAP